jgi:hypothetical protein
MGFDAQALKNWLVSRDVRLRPPADAQSVAQLWQAFPDGVHPDVLSLYAAFDGTEDSDFEAENFLTVWTIEQALTFPKERAIQGQLAIADVDWSCDVALCRVGEAGAPVEWWCDTLPDQSSFSEFWDVVMRGDLWRQPHHSFSRRKLK